MTKKRVLHIITGLDTGGAEMMLLKVIPKLNDSFENKVCCIRGRGIVGNELEIKGIKVFYLELRNIFDFGIVFKFKRIIDEFKPDLIVNYLIHADLFGRILGRLFGVKKIISSQRGFYRNWRFLIVFDYLSKFLVTKYWVQTKFAKNELIRILHLKENNIVVIPNAIDINEFNFKVSKMRVLNRHGIKSSNVNVICVGNLKKGKGYEYLFNAFEIVFGDYKNINLLIAGEGKQKDVYLRQVKNLRSKNNIYFLGRVKNIKELLKICNIFILPTLSEGMSNAILEAMASRLAIVTTDIEVNKEVIDDKITGLLVPTKDMKSIVNSLKQLIVDDELRVRLGLNAYESVKSRFEVKEIVKKIKILFNTV